MEQIRSLNRLLTQRAWQQRLPLSGTFELSPVCNLSCKMCYVRKTPGEVAAHSRRMLTLEQWKTIGDAAAEQGLLYLLLTGGEPLLWPDFRALYEHLHKNGILVCINSNVTLFTPDTVAWLRERPPARVNITLYGAGERGYRDLCGSGEAFARTTAGIDRLLEAGILVKLNASMTPHNVADMEGIIAFAKERELILDMGTYMFPPIRRDPESIGTGDRFTPEEAAYYNVLRNRLSMSPEEYRGYLEGVCRGYAPPPGLDESCIDPVDGTVKCQAGRGTFWITWDGYMTPCGMVPDPRRDVTTLGFAEAWRETVTATDEIRLSGICSGCKNRRLCHACMAMAVAETGTHGGVPVYLCQMARALRETAGGELARISGHRQPM